MSKFYNPIRCDNSFLLIKSYAKIGIEKELKKLNREIEKMSEKLRKSYDNGTTTKQRSKMRINLDAKCQRRDDLERALDVLETRTDIFKAI